ncbi:MAG TPA: endonuclease/exonuclease/phosphatase family protein, partial [Kofleriaceae bacterium]
LIRRTQTAQLRSFAHDNWFNGRNELGIIAGDFNDNPDQKSIDALYAPQIGGTGDFTEYNRGNGNTRDGQPTAHATGDNGPYAKKIDYVFFSTNHAPVNNGPAVSITPTGSDHDMLISSALISKK